MYWLLLFSIVIFFFKKAFSTYFFNDDFFFLKISQVVDLSDFLHFFSPIRQYSYKPVGTELFYFLIHLFKHNLFFSHLIVFLIYFLGLFYLYKILMLLFKKSSLAYLTTFFYGISFIHVFQLYYFGTFQEVAVFSFLTIAFYKFLLKKKAFSLLFFLLALLSKETAILFCPFLISYVLIKNFRKILNLQKKKQIDLMKKKLMQILKVVLPYLFFSLLGILLYQYSLKYVTQLDNYEIIFNPKLALNNGLWYFFWSLGAPNFTSLYFVSLFKPPIADFWKMFKNFPEIKAYYILLIIYYSLFLFTILIYLLKHKKQFFPLLKIKMFLFISFFVFLGPILFFEHRWMVRLMTPLIFVILAQMILIHKFINAKKIYRIVALVLIFLLFFINLKGIPIHESSGTFLLESRFSKSAQKYFDIHHKDILKHRYIYFNDITDRHIDSWGGSEKLKVTLSDQNFIDHFFPGSGIKAIYGFENRQIPLDAYIIDVFDILLDKNTQ